MLPDRSLYGRTFSIIFLLITLYAMTSSWALLAVVAFDFYMAIFSAACLKFVNSRISTCSAVSARILHTSFLKCQSAQLLQCLYIIL